MWTNGENNTDLNILFSENFCAIIYLKLALKAKKGHYIICLFL